MKGTLAFRGSTIETECDFMEIDNNIASRLQIPPQNQQKHSEIPENLPVPMMANFGHFENSDETESSFMSAGVKQGNIQESEHSSEADKESNGKEFSMASAEMESIQQQLREFENLNAEILAGKHDGKAENLKENFAALEDGENVGAGDLVLRFGEETGTLESTQSTRLLQGEDKVGDTTAERHVDNSDLPSHDKLKRENERSEGDKDELKANNFQGIVGSLTTSCDTDHLCNATSPLSLPISDPLTERKNNNDNFLSGVLRGDPLDKEFVFVNRDGTAESELKPKWHPLENSGES